MNLISTKFKTLKKNNQKAFIVYLTVGYPDIETTKELILKLAQEGVDIIELGVPFSDPLADGPIIQKSFQEALKNKINLESVINLVKDIRNKVKIPLIIMSYYNPIYKFGLENFFIHATKVGVDGLIIPDLPCEEILPIKRINSLKKIDLISFISPTTQDERIDFIVKHTQGFVYYLSITGVTGLRNTLDEKIKNSIEKIKKHTSLPVCVGFGISNSNQVKKIISYADGFIIGSAIIKIIEDEKNKKEMIEKVLNFVKDIRSNLK
ncbi:MAG: tryptophan synthase subunit alpha [bacterium]